MAVTDDKFTAMLARLREEAKKHSEAKKVEAPVATETPKVEAPKIETSKIEVPTAVAEKALADVAKSSGATDGASLLAALRAKAKEVKKEETKIETKVETPSTPVESKPLEEKKEKLPEKPKEVAPKVEELAKPSTESVVGSALVFNVLEKFISGLISGAIEKVKVKSGYMKVHRTYTKSGEIVKEVDGDSELIEVPTLTGPTATVSADMGATINLGDYNSAKINVFISVPCYVTEIDNAFLFARNKADELLKKEISSIKGSR